jgi:plastocyanin
MRSSLAKTVRGAIVVGLGVFAVVSTSVPGVTATITIQTIQMKDNLFDLKDQTVKVGDTVVWTNVGQNNHTVTPDPGQTGAFDDSGQKAPGQTYTITVSGPPRTIKYYCKNHGAPGGGGMSGTLVIVP